MTVIQEKAQALPKILVIYVHPDPDNSVANQVMINQIRGLDHVTVHDLYAHYPDFFIDVAHEHQLLLDHDIIVFQHPLYMYSCPALLKEWMDRVLGKGFAFGEGCALADKHWRSVITTGGAQDAFAASGYNKYPMQEILQPFELTALLCRMKWVEPLILYWARNTSDVERYQHAERYRHWLLNPLNEGDAYGSDE
ncbi:glutathione-regulated potassium-efflux system ancillary protein KefG [Vibrio nigripulchritudo ATCC 27043]|uniref:Glutathione-regulated potassium-efflux system ancillary protein KefG n=1 Tax=Vibrio nigripulchritudo SOn1 TaxID=1238450 RepID=A0AAV2VTL1_9VIBR|nr:MULTISPECIES: glutathione-regulated potassium-efflux system ancillary protein KefG [Vibrio]EGU61010.1 glutathione-regulated potassium-efflux system ancillary protein KefG [Vibrio nigripulchritudo ATCC 27043]KJY74228.1 potassium transporter KefG [Vibrio nigripulchritudo]UAB70064.1 glutathione-regulated potassium-efflux system ancillary protein KefG [Vibrio sp. SCSIO 43132]CCO47991.1 Glutathione-regulated potassium-efflux system ancillary protein kefG [Vibrio nigripulchritudo SOn1]BDU35812.1 